MTPSRLANHVALAVFAFGALVDGLGNALIGHADHTARHHHEAGGDSATPPWDVPAHCLFCLDGIAPQPTELVGIAVIARPPRAVEPLPKTTPRRADARIVRPEPRAPPRAAS
jgi:hypothetical protein